MRASPSLASRTRGSILRVRRTSAVGLVSPRYSTSPSPIQSSAEVLRLRRKLESGRLTKDKEAWSKVKLLLEDGTPYPLEGILKFRDITVDPSTGSVTLRAVFPNPDNILLPGMFVRALVEEGVNEQALFVPQQGVTRDARGNPVAMVVDKTDKVEQRLLELDQSTSSTFTVRPRMRSCISLT